MAKWWLFLWSVIFFIQIHGHRGCHVKERMSLLQFKAYVKSNGFDADSLLPSWIEDPHSDCCLWDRVTCSNITHHVIQLSLGSTLNFPYPGAPLNISIFQPFNELRILDLSANGINGWINEKEGSRGLLRLQKLETLALYSNFLSDSSSLGSLTRVLTSLKHLGLAENNLQGPFPIRELSALENLETLDLDFNVLEGSLTVQDLKFLSKLSKLEYLYLHRNNFNKKIIRCLGSLPSLKYLDLSLNGMEGSLADQDFATFPRLEILDLSRNNLVGNIPSKVWELTTIRAIFLAGNTFTGSLPIPGICELNKLERLDLSHNSLEGTLPSCLNNMTSLSYIDLSDNHFDGTFNFSSFANLSKFETIRLTCDGNKLKTDAEYLDQIPLFQLDVLRLSNCNLESIPKFLRHQHQLRVIDLSHNSLNGTFPTWLAESNIELLLLNLRGNSFSGKLNLPTNSMRNILWVDISSNQFNGQLQEDFGKILPNAQFINLSNNHFEGDLPRSICVPGRELLSLDLSNNKFSGEVPKEVFTYCPYLQHLVLSHNKFEGEIFSTSFNLSWLSHLDLSDNQFTGNLSLSNIADQVVALDVLDVSNNKFSGEIPSSIFSLNMIGILALRNNSFEGQFPCNKEKTLTVAYLDLSYNSFSGPLPCCFNQDSLKQLNAEKNQFSGSIPSPLFNFSALRVLNLKHNHLFGSIPNSINGTLPRLRILLLANNFLNGSITGLFCRFKDMSIMDLSNNFFSGPVPQCFNNISWGKVDITSLYRQLSQQPFDFPSPILYHLHIYLSYYKDDMLLPNAPIIEVEVDFVTKNRLNLYQGGPLDLMSGLDLSCNSLGGEIPSALGNLSTIHALNLSHNRLVGSIPISFSKLAQIESLDLSYNYLSGKIPSEMVNLNFLQVFSVAHNNLSGEIPQTTQLSTFNESSFEGNPLLCGMPLKKTCSTPLPPHSPLVPSEGTEGKWFEVDSIAFYASSAATYFVVLLAFVTVLYINPYWQRRWFLFIEDFLDSCYYFVYGTLNKLWN